MSMGEGVQIFGCITIYLEPKWGPLFCLEFRPCFEGFTFKTRGHLGTYKDTGWPLVENEGMKILHVKMM